MNARVTASSGPAVDERRSVGGRETDRLVFVHGSMDVGRSFRNLRNEFPGWTTIAYDRRGYGGSAAGHNGVEKHVRDLAAIAGDRPCVLFGHSLGGVLSLITAARYPKTVRAVIVYEAPLPWLDWWPRAPLPTDLNNPVDVEAAAAAFMSRAVGDEAWQSLPEPKRDAVLGWGPAWAAELLELTDGGWPFVPERIAQPTLVLRGEHADDRQVRGSAVLSRRLPNAQSQVVPGATHVAHMRRAEALAVPVRDFLAGLREA